MPAVTLIRGDDGKLAGLTEKDQRGWAKFLKRVRVIGNSCLLFEWKEPRSGPYHRWAFALWNHVFDAQERFTDFDQFIVYVKTGAGHCDFLPHPDKGLIAVPRSINWASLDEVQFREVANSMFAFLRSEHARQTLWHHLDEEQSWEMIETLLESFT